MEFDGICKASAIAETARFIVSGNDEAEEFHCEFVVHWARVDD